MFKTLLFLGGFIAIVFIISILSQLKIFRKTDKPNSNSVKSNDSINKSENPYYGFRDLAFKMTPEKLQLNLSKDELHVFGTIMEWNVGSNIVTIVAYESGDASMYISSGQIFIGGYAYDEITTIAKDFVNTSKEFISESTLTNEYLHPKANEVKFYLHTTKGIFYKKVIEEDIKNNNTKWSILFNKGNTIITEYRKVMGE